MQKSPASGGVCPKTLALDPPSVQLCRTAVPIIAQMADRVPEFGGVTRPMRLPVPQWVYHYRCIASCVQTVDVHWKT